MLLRRSGAGSGDQVQVQLGEQVAGQASKEDQAKWGSPHSFKHTPDNRLYETRQSRCQLVTAFLALGEG